MAKKKTAKVTEVTKTRLTTADKFYIINNPDGLTHAKLAEVVGCSEVTVDRTLAANGKTKKKMTKVEALAEVTEVAQEVSPSPSNPVASLFNNAMGKATRKDSGGQNHTVGAILTPAAGEIMDEIRKNMPRRPLSETMKNAIHKPKG